MRSLLAGLTVAALLSGCSAGDGRARLSVLAASSLTDAFTALKATYEQQHPSVEVVLSFDSSAILAQQVIEGAPADVLATADEPTMATVADKQLLAGDPVDFARNTLVLVTPPGNPAGITDVRDLQRPGASFAECVPQAPCGDAARRLLLLDGVTAKAVTEEDNVRAVLTKVTLGEVDAGLVYASDALAAGSDVHTVSIRNSARVVNVDPIGVLASSQHPGAAQAWVDLVLSSAGQHVLASYGFQSAP